MFRTKTFDATGIAPGGRLYAGDLNLIQDSAAALTDYTQNHGVSSIAIGDNTLILSKYGIGELSLSAALRISGVVRGLAGLSSGSFTTAQRGAIAVGSRPTGMIIYNSDNARLEFNSGTDAAPNWQPVASTTATGTVSSGVLGSRPTPATAGPNTWYHATDDTGGTTYFSNGSTWTKAAKGKTEAPEFHSASHHPQTGADRIVMSLTSTFATRPAANAVAVGTLFLASDTGVFSRSDGVSAWASIGGSSTGAHASTHALGGGDPLTALGIATGMIADSAITLAKLAASSVDTSKIIDGSVNSAKITDNSIWTSDIANGAVSLAKLAADALVARFYWGESTGSANPGAGSGVWASYGGSNCSTIIYEAGTYVILFGARGTGNASAATSYTGLAINGTTVRIVTYAYNDGSNCCRAFASYLSANDVLSLYHNDSDSSRPINSDSRFIIAMKVA